MTLNGNLVHLHTSVIIPIRDNFRHTHNIRKTSLLKQGTSWYTLDSKEYLLPPSCSDDLEI